MSPAVVKRAPPKKEVPTYAGSSWDDKNESMCILVQGQFSAGKTTLAATLSKHFPKAGLPTQKHTGKGPKYDLKDLFWLVYDKGALLSFRERGIAVPRFDVRQYSAQKQVDVIRSTEVGLREIERAAPDWAIVDTVSVYDKMLDVYWQTAMLNEKGIKQADTADPKSLNKMIEAVQAPKYGRMFSYHKLLHDNLMQLGCGVVYLCHSRAVVDWGLGSMDDREKQKKVRQTLATVSTGPLVPDITGKGAGIYKADARLQLVVEATTGVGGKLTRAVWADPHSGYETKNSWELSIKGKQEPNLRKILEKIK